MLYDASMDELSLIFGLGILGILFVLLLLVAKVDRLQRKVDRLLEQAGIAFPGPASARVRGFAALPGRKIEAIRAYQAETGASLAEAKDAVENLHAESSQKPPARKGMFYTATKLVMFPIAGIALFAALLEYVDPGRAGLWHWLYVGVTALLVMLAALFVVIAYMRARRK